MSLRLPMALSEPKPNTSLTVLPGHLYVVATPIGNLHDLSPRARSILSQADLLACEDTRTTGQLLARLGLPHKTLVSYHDHNERELAPKLADELASGKSVALVSDAGTPAISDPGFRLVRAARRRALPVVPVPGPCAFAAALSASGLPSNGFLFVGFLPPKSAARIAFFEKHRDFAYTLILYESCHRIEKAVTELHDSLGPERVICVAKELTKLHESFLVGPAAQVRDALSQASLKGEFVLLIAPQGFVL